MLKRSKKVKCHIVATIVDTSIKEQLFFKVVSLTKIYLKRKHTFQSKGRKQGEKWSNREFASTPY